MAGSQSYYKSLADKITNLIEEQRAIVYTDFVKDVAPLAIALSERGINSCSYHGQKMSSHDKVKAVDNWCAKDSFIQVG
jgi:superfamily II DNA helicase RecQ